MDDAAAPYPFQSSGPLERSRIAAVPSAAPRRPIVMVLGMHRSGTSLCSNVLSMLGIDMADQIRGPGQTEPEPSNPRGHWERWEIVEFHDRILALFDRGYFGLFHDFPLPGAWWADPRVVQIKREMIAFLERRIGAVPFGFKDPRAVRLMPLWLEIFAELRLAPRIVLCLRNPAQVARSVQARDGLDPEIGEYRWLVHLLDFFRYAGAHEFCTVEYEAWFDEPRANLDKLRKFLGIEWQQAERDLDWVLSDIVDPALRHDDAARRQSSRPLMRSLHELASRAEHDSAARGEIAAIASQFTGFQHLHKAFHRSFENLAGIAARLPGIEAAEAAARQRAEGAEGSLAQVQAALEVQQARLAETERAREEAAAALAAREQEATGLRSAVASAEARAGGAEGLLAEIQAGLEAQQAQLAEIERAREEAAAALAAREQEAAGLRSAAASAEERARGAQTRVAEMWARLETQQARLAESERVRADAAAALASAEQREADLRRALAEREAAMAVADERAGHAEARAATLLADLETQRARLAESNRAGSEGAAALARAGREAADLRAAATDLRREIAAARGRAAAADEQVREHTAAATAMQEEIAALRGEVAAARHVAKALAAALRDAPVPPPKLVERRGWGWGVLRFFGIRLAAGDEPDALRESLS